MRKFTILLFLFCSCQFSALNATTPADSQIKSALADIERYEKQFAGTTTTNTSTLKRTLKLLGITRDRLDSSTNQTDPSWIEANQRYNNLANHLDSLLGSTNASTVESTPTLTQSRSITPQSSGASGQMISQYRVRIKKIQRDIESRISVIDQGGPKPFQSQEYAAKFDVSAQQFADSLAKYAQYQNDPDVIVATNSLTTYNNMIAFGKQHAAKEISELGNIQQTLATIEQQTRQIKMPATPQAPFHEGQLSQWIIDLSNTRKTAAAIYKPLPQIRERAYLPNNPATVQQGGAYDLNDVDRLQRSLRGMATGIQTTIKSYQTDLSSIVDHISQDLPHYNSYDPSKPEDQANHFLAKGRADEIIARLTTDKINANEAATFAKLLKDPSYDKRAYLATQVDATIATYRTNLQKAYELVQMPQAASKDSQLTKVAQETLSNYDYIEKCERLVISSDKAHRSKETSEEKYDDIDVSLSGTITLTGTKTTYLYEWEQFQVATAEPVGDKYFIFYTTLRYFTSGSTTTPLNRWIVSGRNQSSEIPFANIAK